ncbi:hypothetical protein JCM3775_005014 [Rhodotorula graminis]
MAAQSGIVPTQDLLDTWTTALQDPVTRLVKIAIQDEQLVPAGTFTTTSSDPDDSDAVERDFALFERPDIVEDKVPAYFVYRLTPPPSSTFLFTSYVPDHAPVRAKMLYASTRNTLVRALGDARLVESVFATAKADLTHAAYLSHVAHRAADAPLTSREQEMRDEIDPANETVILSPSQPTSLSSLPTSSPAYLLARHPALASSSPGALVLVYSCPAASPVRHRLLYSSAVVPLYRVAAERFAGVKVARKLETDSPSEITRAWLDAELGAASSSTDTPSASGAATPTQGPQQVQEDDKPKFARPARPGRRR